MKRSRDATRSKFVILIGAAAAAVAAAVALRHVRGAAMGRRAPGGILIGDAGVYDAVSRAALGSLFERVAADVAAVAPDGAQVLEVGCGPGLLSIRLARYGLGVIGLDLDPAMIERATANAARSRLGGERPPSFLVGDVGKLEFRDGSFDTVVSTLSFHHWADPSGGLAEIGRVLRPGGRAVVWDLRPGVVPFHPHLPDPVEHASGSPLHVVSATPWRWPWRFTPTRRIELVRADGTPPTTSERGAKARLGVVRRERPLP